jgi:hypothetical protein
VRGTHLLCGLCKRIAELMDAKVFASLDVRAFHDRRLRKLSFEGTDSDQRGANH